MLQALTSLIDLQRYDTAAEGARRRLAEFPAIERALDEKVASAIAALESVKTLLAENQQTRRALEKDVAQVDSRLARFDDHKAAVKTNHEYTALLHEISTAKTEKDAIEEKILILLESADAIGASIKDAETALSAARAAGTAARASLAQERSVLDAELARLTAERSAIASDVDRALVQKYEQLLKQRRLVAVAAMEGELCTACHVRLRPNISQQIRRNDSIVQCDSCQRILYFVPKAASTA